MNKFTIQKVPDDIAEHLRVKGVTREANRFLRAAKIMDEAGVLDHLILMHQNGIHQHSSLLEMIEKAVNIGRLIKGDLVSDIPKASAPETPDPEPENDPPPMFSA